MPQNLPLVLLILDGWGYSEHAQYNAIHQAHTPQWDEWWQHEPHTLLQASGIAMGLPDKQMGNSEVGHMHIGAGRVIVQELSRINQAISSQEFYNNPVLNQTIDELKHSKKTLHIMGLLSPGGVHSHEQHLFALLKLCDKKHYASVCLHLFLDGRDTPPKSALNSIERLNQELNLYPVGCIRSITGRYYAMDRDHRWERLEPIFNLLTQGHSEHYFTDAQTAIEFYYQQDTTDEFIPPTSIGKTQAIEDGDALLFFNFRSDRARQLTAAFADPQFSGFARACQPRLSHFMTMTQYDETLNTKIIFPPLELHHTLGQVLCDHGLKQLRIAETEKYAHVTFFLNGGSEQVFAQEQRILIPSPKVATYDLQPEMSAPEITQKLIEVIKHRSSDVILCNFANADMVGHTGNFAATVRAIECLDQCMQQIWHALKKQQGVLLITADHGNAESMYDPATKQNHTAHTIEPVPFVCVGSNYHLTQTEGSLIDIAPTMLALLGITPPKEMTGRSLLENNLV